MHHLRNTSQFLSAMPGSACTGIQVTRYNVLHAAEQQSVPECTLLRHMIAPVCLLQALSDMQAAGGQANSRVMFTFLQACWGAALTRQQVARVFAEAAAMRAVRRPDESVYAALLTFAQRQGVPEQALDVWRALREARCSPLLSACHPASLGAPTALACPANSQGLSPACPLAACMGPVTSP